MAEFLIEKTSSQGVNVNDSDTSSGKDKDEFFKFDPIKETLLRIRRCSRFKKILAFILSKFYSCPALIICISFIFGFLTFGLPLLFIYSNIITNIMIPILIISIIGLTFSTLLIIIHIIDGKRNKTSLISKWERKNILKNIGVSYTIIILIVAICFLIKFYSQIYYYIKKEEIILVQKDSILAEELVTDFWFKYIFNIILCKYEQIDYENKSNKIQYYIRDYEYLDILKKKLMYAFIPLLILSFNKVLKCLLIEVKFVIEQFILFFGAFSFCLYTIIIYCFKNEKLIQYNIKLISCFQNVIIGIIYIGYISWMFLNSIKLIHNPKDKSFAIRRYKFANITAIIGFDVISFLGASCVYFSILYFYLSITFGEEIFAKLINSFFFLKIGFLLILVGNSYYFGHHFLSVIFRPISVQYAPYELKNNNYVKANRKLWNTLNTRKKSLRLKDVRSLK